MNTYRPLNKIMLRTPLFSTEVIERALTDRDFFSEVILSDAFKKAIICSSPDLWTELSKYFCDLLSESKASKMRLSILKYLSRMSTRCTPFGMFAGNSVCKIAENCNIELGTGLNMSIRLDMSYLTSLWHKLHSDASIMRQEKYRHNSSIYKIGNNYRFVAYSFNGNSRAYCIREVSGTGLLSYVLSQTDRFIRFEELISRLTGQYNLSIDEATSYLFSLIKEMILVGNLSPIIVGPDYLSYLTANIQSSHLTGLLEEIKRTITQLQNIISFDEYFNTIRNLESEVKSIGLNYNRKYLLQVDCARNLTVGNFPRRVVAQLQECFDLFRRICPVYTNRMLENFKKKFAQRYEDQEILLIEALDPDLGIGYGQTNDKLINPLINDIKLPNKQPEYLSIRLTPFTKLLLNKLRSLDDNILELTDDDIKPLPLQNKRLPLSMAAMFSVVDREQSGEYCLKGVQFMGSSAVNLLGRFAYSSDEVLDIVKTVTRKEQEACTGKIVAEIVHLTESRTSNILSRPHIRDYEIWYNSEGGCESSEVTVIPLNDIIVSVKSGRLILTSKKYNKEIIPRLTTAHNYNNNPTPIYQFLCDMQTYGCQSSLSFSWMGLDKAFDNLPRVVYKNIILSPARWMVKSMELKKISFVDFKEWKCRRNIPKRINIVSGDNKLYLNIDDESCFEILIEESKKRPTLIIEEFIPSNSIVTDNFGKSFANEFIIPFILDDEKD